MSMKLTVFKQENPVEFIQIAAFGDISLEVAQRWIDSAPADLNLVSSSEFSLSFTMTDYVLPEGAHLTQLSFKDKGSVVGWSYAIECTAAEQRQLVDHLTVNGLQRDLVDLESS
jgi:hypothetical protein